MGVGYTLHLSRLMKLLVSTTDDIFTISDSHGDGMCCNSGQGGYKLTLGGEVVKEGGEFGESESFVVEVGPQGPSRAPTPAPTCTQDGGSCYSGDSCCSGRCGNNFCEG